MQKLIFALALVLAVAGTAAAGADQMTYQGRLTDLSGAPVVGDTAAAFTIYNAVSAGTALWAETLSITCDANGVFTVELGDVHPLNGSILNAGSRYLGIKVIGDTEMTPRQSLTAAPYSIGGVPSVGQVSLFGGTNVTTPTTLDSFAVNVPGPGVLLITVSGNYWLNADATSTTSLITTCYLGLCTTANSSANCDGTYYDFYLQDADNASPTNETPTFILTRTINVGSAGTRWFYLNGQSSGVAPAPNLSLYGNTRATAVWYPGSLTVQTSRTISGDGTDLPVQQDK